MVLLESKFVLPATETSEFSLYQMLCERLLATESRSISRAMEVHIKYVYGFQLCFFFFFEYLSM